MENESDFTRYWNDFTKFNEYSLVPVHRKDQKSLELFYQYLIVRSNKELKEEVVKQSEKMDQLTKALLSK